MCKDKDFKKYIPVPDGIIANFITNPLSIVLLKKLSVRKFSPNYISAASLGAGIISCFLMLTPNRLLWIIAAFLIQFSFVLDALDGNYARATMQTSYFGAWLDRISDRIIDTLVVISMCISFYINFNDIHIVKYIFLIILSNLIFWSNYDTITITGMFKFSERDKLVDNVFVRIEKYLFERKIRFVFGRDLYLFSVFIGALLFNPYITIFLILIFENLNTVIKFYLYERANKDYDI